MRSRWSFLATFVFIFAFAMVPQVSAEDRQQEGIRLLQKASRYRMHSQKALSR
jgi:hypothetical protein